MKRLRRLCAGTLLVLALSVPALAGEIPNPPGVAGDTQFPGVAGQMETPLADGTIHTGLYYVLSLFF